MRRPKTSARYLMTSSLVCDPEASSLVLSDLCILVVEDSWDVGTGLKLLLEAWGADVAGPAATTADARRMISERIPDVALVDINLRNGEHSYDLIDELHQRSKASASPNRAMRCRVSAMKMALGSTPLPSLTFVRSLS